MHGWSSSLSSPPLPEMALISMAIPQLLPGVNIVTVREPWTKQKATDIRRTLFGRWQFMLCPRDSPGSKQAKLLEQKQGSEDFNLEFLNGLPLLLQKKSFTFNHVQFYTISAIFVQRPHQHG